eukprot:6173941-Pleurochrysis_carterae.AAC.1
MQIEISHCCRASQRPRRVRRVLACSRHGARVHAGVAAVPGRKLRALTLYWYRISVWYVVSYTRMAMHSSHMMGQ